MGLKFRYSASEGILRSVGESPGIVAPLATVDGFGLAISPSVEPGGGKLIHLVPEEDKSKLRHVGAAEAVEACVDEDAVAYLKFALPPAALLAAQAYSISPDRDVLLDGMIEFLEEFREAVS